MKPFVVSRFTLALPIFAVATLTLAAHAAPKTKAPVQKPTSSSGKPIPGKPTKPTTTKNRSSDAMAVLRLEFDKQDAKRKAAPAGTQARAEAAEAAARSATQIAWAAFDAEKRDEAATWFARRATLRLEAYNNWTTLFATLYAAAEKRIVDGQAATTKAYADLQAKYPDLHRELLAKLEAAGIVPQPVDFTSSMAAQQIMEAIVTPLRTSWQEAVKAKNVTLGAELVDKVVKLRAVSLAMGEANAGRSQRGTYASMQQMAARQIGRQSDLLRYAERDLETERADLARFQTAKIPPERIAAQIARVAGALETVAGVREEMALYDDAIAAYTQSIEMRKSLPETAPDRALNQPLFSLGRLHQNLGNLASAREFYQQAVEFRERDAPLRETKFAAIADKDTQMQLRAGDTVVQVVLLNNYGALISALGDIKGAFAMLERANQLAQSMPSKGTGDGSLGFYRTSLQASTLGNIAALQAESGEEDRALATFQRIINMRRANHEDERAAVAYMNAAGILWNKNKTALARSYAGQARHLYTTTQNLRGVSAATNFLATLARDGGDLKTAETYSQQALAIAQKTGDRGWIASAKRNLAQTRHAQKRSAEALALLAEVEVISRRNGAPLDIKSTLQLQGRILEETGHKEEALAKYKEAIELLESVRATARDQSTFSSAENNYAIYKSIVQLLIKMKKPDEAFDYLSRAKSKQMQDSLRLDSIKSGDGALQLLLKKGGDLQNRLRTVQENLQGEQALPEAERDSKRVETLKLVSAQTQAEFYQVARKIREANPNFDKITSVKPTELKAAQRSIPDKVVLVQYVPLGEQLYIFLVTKTDLKIYTPSVKPADLWKKVSQLRSLIEAAKDGYEAGEEISIKDWNSKSAAPLRDSLTGLYDMLLAVIEPELEGKDIVAFIPTQQLFYVPMHALAKKQGDGLRFLIEDKQVVYLASADVLKVVQPHDASQLGTGLFAMGDPEGADLEAARVEVQNIAKSFPGSEVVVGDKATKSTLLRPANMDKRIWHFATHGFLNPTAPDESYIQLAPGASGKPEEAHLSFSEVYGLDLKRVDLVTLSACQTALGERNPDGSDISGLAQSFSEYAGARSVLASLWSVADESTGNLMSDFYQKLAAGTSKAKALQAAQIALMKNPKTNHPFFWAPFVLMGDWR